MIRALIVEDELHCQERLSKLLKQHATQIQLVGTCQSVSQALETIPAKHPDVVFLDIQLGQETSFELLQALPVIDFAIVFTTAYDQYAIKAFKFSAVDYLLKPIDPDDLAATISRLAQHVSVKQISQKMEILFHNLQSSQNNPKKIAIPTLEGLTMVSTAEIIRCQSDVNYTDFFLLNGKSIKVSKTLKHYEELLSDFNFLRVHNSHLVNLDHVEKYTRGKGGFLTMQDGAHIEVSVRKKAALLDRLV